MQHQLRIARMIDPHAHTRFLDRRVPIHKDRRVRHRIIQQRCPGRCLVLELHSGAERPLDVRLDANGHRREVRVENPNKIPPRRKRRRIVPANADAISRRADQRERIVSRSIRERAALQINFHRPGIRRHAHLQLRRIWRHIHHRIKPAVGQNFAHNPNSIQQIVLARLDPHRREIDAAGVLQRVINHRQLPGPGGPFAHEIPQAARPIHWSRLQDFARIAVVINEPSRALKTAVIIQHRVIASKTQISQQIPSVLVCDDVREDNILDDVIILYEAKQQRRFGLLRVAVRDQLGRDKELNDQIAIFIALAERRIGRERIERIIG